MEDIIQTINNHPDILKVSSILLFFVLFVNFVSSKIMSLLAALLIGINVYIYTIADKQEIQKYERIANSIYNDAKSFIGISNLDDLKNKVSDIKDKI